MNNHRAKSPVVPRDGASLSRAATRLLDALGKPGSAAVPDPVRDDHFVVRTSRNGVSLGQGSHPRTSLDELARNDLVDLTEGRTGLRLAEISDAGRARLRRAGGGEDAFAAQHRSLESRPENDGSVVQVNANESPLDWLRRRRGRDGEPLIDPACYEAGERLRRDLTIGGLLPSVTARWDGSVGGGGLRDPAAAADATISARQRARAALTVVGRDHADILVDLCGFLKGLEQIEREHGWPPRSGKVVLRLALRRLAEHYGLGTEARGPDRARGLRAWHSEEERAAASA